MAVGHKMGKRVGLDPSTRIAMNALFVPDREPAKRVDLDPSTRIAMNALFVPDREPAKRVDLDPSTRIAMNVRFVPDREPATARRPRHYPKPMPIDAPRSVLSPRSQLFRIQFVGATPDRGPTTLKKVQIRVAAIVAAANTLWPIGLRILDHEEREVFGQQKADRRRTSRQVGDDHDSQTAFEQEVSVPALARPGQSQNGPHNRPDAVRFEQERLRRAPGQRVAFSRPPAAREAAPVTLVSNDASPS